MSDSEKKIEFQKLAAHKHMLIPEELFSIRQSLLNEAFVEAKASAELVERLLKIDVALKLK